MKTPLRKTRIKGLKMNVEEVSTSTLLLFRSLATSTHFDSYHDSDIGQSSVSLPIFLNKQVNSQLTTLKQIVFTLFFAVSFSISGFAQGNILHVTRTAGYDHSTRTQSLAMFTEIANTHNWNIDNTDNSGTFDNLSTLLNYDLIIFSNTSGNVLNSQLREDNLRAWFYQKPNACFLGIHAAFDTHVGANNFSFYSDTLVGGTVQQGPNHTANNYNGVIDQVANHPTLASIPDPWNKVEEYYYWLNSPGFVNSDFTELMRVRQTGGNSYDEPRMVTQLNTYPTGQKVFATSLGHARSNFTDDEDFYGLMENATLWLLGNGSLDIRFPDEIELTLEEGYYYLDSPPILDTYYVYNNLGQLLYTGNIEAYNNLFRFPVYEANASMIIYKSYGFMKKTVQWNPN